MPQYFPDDDIIIVKRKKQNTADMASDLLEKEGYKAKTKPRAVNRTQETHESTKSKRENLNERYGTHVRHIAEDEVAPEAKKEKRINIKNRVVVEDGIRFNEATRKSSTPFPISYIFAILLVTALFFTVVFMFVKVDDLTSYVSQLKTETNEFKSEKNDLEYKKNSMYDLSEIERIAKDEYGMVSQDSLPREYIASDNDDRAEVIDTGARESAAKMVMSGFGNAISDLLTYIN